MQMSTIRLHGDLPDALFVILQPGMLKLNERGGALFFGAARMEQSDIRERPVPHFASPHAGRNPHAALRRLSRRITERRPDGDTICAGRAFKSPPLHYLSGIAPAPPTSRGHE
jgi:hypothetical protein